MSSHKKSNRFSRPAIQRAATDRVPLSAKNFASFTMSETDIENVRGKTSKEILLHSPAGLALNLDNSVVPPGIYNDCHGHNFSIDLTPFEVNRLIYKPQGFVANISISAGKVHSGAKSQGGKIIIYPFVHFYPHQCVIDWYMSTVSLEEIRKQLDLPSEGEVKFTDIEGETIHVDMDGDIETPRNMSQSYSIRSAKVFKRGHGYQTILNSIIKDSEIWRSFKEPDIVEVCFKHRFIPHVKYD